MQITIFLKGDIMIILNRIKDKKNRNIRDKIVCESYMRGNLKKLCTAATLKSMQR